MAICCSAKAAKRSGLTQALAPMTVSDPNEELTERASELTRYHEIWWQLVNRELEPVYRPVIEAYESYFETTTHALLQGFSVVAYQLFERRRDSYSIHWLLRHLEKDQPDCVAEIRAEMDRHKPVLVKVFSLRNGVYAHRSISASSESIFSAAGITPNEMRSVVTLVQQSVARLVAANGGREATELRELFWSHATRARNETEALLVRLHPDRR